ncbi:MAG: bifunctional glycosyltransferase/class I SAM-dependent methyltransferase, partial [Myxococcota bacterium]|nr:bifunctional glycosyltransferase/class I SAM-dependent methyltransferase [Myxococcota bacterium]
EIVVMLEHPDPGAQPTPDSLLGGRQLELRFHHPPRYAGYGAARKTAFEYALRKGFDHAILMQAGGHPADKLPELLQRVLDHPDRLTLATRKLASERLVHRSSSTLQNHILGLRLDDYAASFRVYPLEAIARIPFQLNSDDALFDAEILLQFRALGAEVQEQPILDGPPGDGSGNDGVLHAARCLFTAVMYRLHQFHATRDGRFLVDHDIHYTLKLSDTGSHMQIVSAIRAQSRVLDLGCSQGLLARPLLEKNVRVVGVDVGPGERLARELGEYHQHDLESPLEIPFQREFDYVVCADVIEHIRNRTQLLRSARRYLKPNGRLIISTPNIALWFYRLSLAVGRFEYGPRGVLDETHVHLFTGASFRREVERAGFEVVGERVTALPFEVVFESTGRSRLVRALARLYHLMARLWPSMFAYQYVLEAEITTLDEEATSRSASTSA